ncbi:DJ-1/PfpI family protein [archaeon]|nr:MAG: DJ-1/PfpI family protein [archaeon]
MCVGVGVGVGVQTADVLVSDVAGEKYDMIALPGGMPGAEHLSNNATLTRMLLEQKTAHRWIAAICASPAVVLAKHGILTPDTPATCYPGMTSKLPNVSTSGAPCVVSGRIITSRGPGTAMLYGLQCVSCLMGKDAAHSVAEGMLVDDSVLV